MPPETVKYWTSVQYVHKVVSRMYLPDGEYQPLWDKIGLYLTRRGHTEAEVAKIQAEVIQRHKYTEVEIRRQFQCRPPELDSRYGTGRPARVSPIRMCAAYSAGSMTPAPFITIEGMNHWICGNARCTRLASNQSPNGKCCSLCDRPGEFLNEHTQSCYLFTTSIRDRVVYDGVRCLPEEHPLIREARERPDPQEDPWRADVV